MSASATVRLKPDAVVCPAGRTPVAVVVSGCHLLPVGVRPIYFSP
jgi:hypothetical protein